MEAEHGHGGGLKQKAKEVWHDIKEITPGTKVGHGRVPGRLRIPLHTGRAGAWLGLSTALRGPQLRGWAHVQEHRSEFGTGMALGGYRSQMGKR